MLLISFAGASARHLGFCERALCAAAEAAREVLAAAEFRLTARVRLARACCGSARCTAGRRTRSAPRRAAPTCHRGADRLDPARHPRDAAPSTRSTPATDRAGVVGQRACPRCASPPPPARPAAPPPAAPPLHARPPSPPVPAAGHLARLPARCIPGSRAGGRFTPPGIGAQRAGQRS